MRPDILAAIDPWPVMADRLMTSLLLGVVLPQASGLLASWAVPRMPRVAQALGVTIPMVVAAAVVIAAARVQLAAASKNQGVLGVCLTPIGLLLIGLPIAHGVVATVVQLALRSKPWLQRG